MALTGHMLLPPALSPLLAGMQERVQLLGGRLKLESKPVKAPQYLLKPRFNLGIQSQPLVLKSDWENAHF